jgi:aspartyl-tRNA(Asn)/glutamyl-tRNA(Gln) amidotransferase subunit B
MVDMQKLLVDTKCAINECRIGPDLLAEMIGLIEGGTISGKIAKELLPDMFGSGQSAKALVEERGLVQISDASELEAIVREVIEANPGPVADYRSGTKKALGFLVGQVMKATQGKANPKMVNEMFSKELGG